MNRKIGCIVVLGLLQGCRLFDAPSAPSEPWPPPGAPPAPPLQITPAPPSPPPPSPAPSPATLPVPTPTPTPTPYPAAPVAAETPAPGIQAGPAHAAQPSMLRSRPQGSAQVEHYIPAGASLRLQVRQVNGDGAWWFAEYQGATGWVSEAGLSQ